MTRGVRMCRKLWYFGRGALLPLPEFLVQGVLKYIQQQFVELSINLDLLE